VEDKRFLLFKHLLNVGLLKEYSELLKTRVLERAQKEASNRSQRNHNLGTADEQSSEQSPTTISINGMDMALAIKDFEDGHPAPLPPASPPPPSWGSRVLESISGVTIISTLLAFAFGILGVLAYTQNIGNKDSYLDIAKLFAGAIVGSTGATAVAAAKR
jgi:hypothetical protein